jgi:hypothetical protein
MRLCDLAWVLVALFSDTLAAPRSSLAVSGKQKALLNLNAEYAEPWDCASKKVV